MSAPLENPEVSRLAEHLFRQESGKLVSALVGIFGVHRLQMAEDVVQEALVRALQTWPFYGVPANPSAWLMQTAKNRALDLIRREKSFLQKQPEIQASLEALPQDEDPRFDDEIADGRLRLLFACCHPLLPREDQTVLALRTLCGLGVGEIAAAYLASEAAIAKRLTRAKGKIEDLRLPFEIPAGAELLPRLDGVLQVVYLLFSEGYKASNGVRLMKIELCHEAIRLGKLIAAHPSCDVPRTHALLALMLLDAARLPAREDAAGNLLRLQEQDRRLWDRGLIAAGLLHLSKATGGSELTEFHLQAGIAACHCTADDDASTDWRRILDHYDRWRELSDSPVVALNRAVAVSKVEGPAAALDALAELQKRGWLDGYYLFHAVLGDLREQLGELPEAAAHFQHALRLVELPAERQLLERRLQACDTDQLSSTA